MAELKSPFRYDFVGSFLRPQHLKEARAQFKAGEIDRAALTAVENEESAQGYPGARFDFHAALYRKAPCVRQHSQPVGAEKGSDTGRFEALPAPFL